MAASDYRQYPILLLHLSGRPQMEWKPGQKVSSRSVQPFGAASTRPRSPHYTDQMQLFVDHKLKPVHFWRDDLLAQASSRKTVTTAR